MYKRELNAICFGDLKQAAIYFDRVFPVVFRTLRPNPEGVFCLHSSEFVPLDVSAKLIFGDSAPEWKIIEYITKHWEPFFKEVSQHLTKLFISTDPNAYDELEEKYLTDFHIDHSRSIRECFYKIGKDIGLEYSNILLNKTSTKECDFGQAYSTITLNNLPSIDVESASWEQIMEFRNDGAAKEKLRRFRLFVYDNYAGKSNSYIEDDFGLRLIDCEREISKHGFEIVSSSVSVLLDSKSLQSAAIAGLTTSLFGGPLAGLTAGCMVELGSLSVEYASRKYALKNLEQGHDLAYLIEAKKRLTK